MNTAENKDQIENILQECFPNADKIQIIENSTNEMHKSVVSKIIDLTIEYEEEGEQRKKFIIMKIPITSQASSFHEETEMFTREAFMYDIIIPQMNSYLDVSLTPFCYKTTDSGIIILENLIISNYERLSNNRLNLKQCLPIVEALAHFHAASYKISQVYPDHLSKTIFHNTPVLEWRQRLAIFWEPVLLEILRRNNESLLIPKLKNISHYLKQEDNDVGSRIRYSKFKFFVLNHGDFRHENVLLRYDSNDMIDGVKIVDFQTCFWSTPMCDFMYFLIQSAQVDVFENHFETLLDWYLECLNEKLKTLSCSTIYEKQNFLEDLKTLDFCCIEFIMISAIISYPFDRAPLVDIIFQKNTENIQYYIETCINDELFTSQVLGSFRLCKKLGLFDSSESHSPKS